MSAICIIGMHRSGTSVIARLLNAYGLNLGPDDGLLGPGHGNETGHFEHKGFLELNEALLRHFGGSWECPPKMRRSWEGDPAVRELIARGRVLIDALADHAPWGWKEPRTTMFIPFWQKLVPGVRYVICIRNPLEVARSLAERDGMTIPMAAALWRRYTSAAIVQTHGRPRIMTFYHDYFRKPLRELNGLALFCGLEKVDDLSKCKEILLGELRHHDHTAAELAIHPLIPLDCKLLYLGLRAARRGCP